MDTKYNKYYYKYQKYKDKYSNLSNNNRNSIKPENKYKKDMKEIYKIAENVKILGMAEATHGQEEITKLRIKIFKNLVKKHNYTVFVLEDQYSCCENINHYIKTGKGNIKKIILNLMWFWWSFDMLFLIRWMRKYNMRNNNILEFRGLDIQYLCYDYTNNNDEAAKIAKNKFNLNKKIDQDDWVKADGFRDKSMYNVFMKIYDPNKKYFIYAHNYHISKNDLVGGDNNAIGSQFEGRYFRGDNVKWFGNYLFKKFGKDYFSIGNHFKEGSYLETFDIIEQRKESGLKTDYSKLKDSDSDTFIIIKNIPRVGKIDPYNFNEGLSIFENSSYKYFDAIFIIKKEYPIKLFHYY